ncbi:Rcr2p [Sugiyamaella lignohabitans]|uniref:Rcr2p n=1 Tax=Sugiyamaella lignohabitans TaxID=796027 RepID=A0A167FF13_9ASCO|nr:Rcr2p [Sugiyamaella lignohabitans]ANB15216.1 Rcr2p [Sugiyamaella lignohabitans]
MIIPTELERRQFFCNTWNGVCVNSGWGTWGRWVLLAAIIVVFIILALLMRAYSSRRVRSGKAPVAGTGWMVPPSYYQSQQQYDNQGPPAAPPYNPNLGHGDAGYYDNQGNFVEHNQPPAAEYAPPPGPPPPNHGEQQGYEMNPYPYDRKGGNIEQPSPAHFNENNAGGSSSQYYSPPSHPPPGFGTAGMPGQNSQGF